MFIAIEDPYNYEGNSTFEEVLDFFFVNGNLVENVEYDTYVGNDLPTRPWREWMVYVFEVTDECMLLLELIGLDWTIYQIHLTDKYK